MTFLKENLAYVKRHREIVISGTLSLLGYLYLALNSRAYAELSLLEMWAVCLSCALLSFYVCWHYSKAERRLEPDTFPVLLMLVFAVLFRLAGVSTFPILEDDFYRFLWDGRMTLETGSPYSWVPADFFGDLHGFNINDHYEEILGSINHPEVATIYGPVLQTIFAAAYVIAPGELWPLQIIFALADIGIILLLLRLTKARYVLLYAWSPLIIKEFAISAHPDVVGAFFLVFAFYLYNLAGNTTQHSKNSKRVLPIKKLWFWIAVCLALATGVKIFALIFAPLLLRFQWRCWLLYFACLLILALPFALGFNPNLNQSFNDSSNHITHLLLGIQSVWLPEGLKAMAIDWLFNAPLYYLAQTFISIAMAKSLLLGSFVGVAGIYFFRLYFKRQYLPIRIDRLYGLFFLCIPVFNPWYLVWLLPFAAIYPSRWAWTASIALLLAYASGINLMSSTLNFTLDSYQLYQQPIEILGLQFGLIAVALTIDCLGQQKKKS